ncbi:anti-repressor SinI family protein [Ammoniphilus sp. YIM 78166]
MSKIELDQEWLQLIQEARDMGISLEEIQQFLSGQVKEGI